MQPLPASLDLTALPDNVLTGVEVIDLSSPGVQTLSINPHEVLRLVGGAKRLTVIRNSATCDSESMRRTSPTIAS